jgi:NAD(P)-dependent dehydrogenase (short-subunit alcohol dehydrogenase family)
MALESFFKDRVYAISGGASGIGLATSKLLLKYGAKVSVGDIRFADNLLSELGQEISTGAGTAEDKVLLQKIDVRSRDDVEAWMAATVEKFGKLDGAANVAGTIPKDHNVGGIEDVDDEQWRFVMDVNVYGIMNCMRAELKHIGKGKGEGGDKTGKDFSIVNAGSGLSLQGREFTDAYTTSKHAVLGLTRCAAKEVGKRGVRVNCIAP